MPAAPQALRCGLQIPSPFAEPVAVVGPPAPRPCIGGSGPCLAIDVDVVGGTVAGAGLGGGRVDQRLDVTTCREHESPGAAEQKSAAGCILPGDDVLVQSGDRVAIERDRTEIDRGAEHLDLSRARERVFEADPDEFPLVQPAASRTVSWFQ